MAGSPTGTAVATSGATANNWTTSVVQPFIEDVSVVDAVDAYFAQSSDRETVWALYFAHSGNAVKNSGSQAPPGNQNRHNRRDVPTAAMTVSGHVHDAPSLP